MNDGVVFDSYGPACPERDPDRHHEEAMSRAAQPADVKASYKGGRTRYTFGDSDLAAARLAVVADAFAESSQRFILNSSPTSSEVAVDLGCGPGFTTHL